jgi:thiol-disulfide isomerase/thioredoxin
MGQTVFKLICISVVIFGLVSCKEEIAQVGRAAPEIAAYDMSGQEAKLADWQGVRLLTFWSSSCGVCMAELKELENLAAAYPNKIALIAVNVDNEQVDLQTVIHKYRLNLPIVRDQLKITGERYRVIGMNEPSCFSPVSVFTNV